MSAAERREKDRKMAADLKKRGIYHGKRLTSTTCDPTPRLGVVGSAAYRRRHGRNGRTGTLSPDTPLKRYSVVNTPYEDLFPVRYVDRESWEANAAYPANLLTASAAGTFS